MGEPSALKILKELNGYFTGDPARHCAGFGDLTDDGSTTCASWIYSGVYPAVDKNLAEQTHARRARSARRATELGLGVAGQSPDHVQPRVGRSRRKPWSEKKKWVWWDAEQKKWAGYDVPDYHRDQTAQRQSQAGRASGMDALPGTAPFIMRPDGVGWLFVPAGLVDGPLPTHYEPVESPVNNPLYKQQISPVLKYWKDPGNPLAKLGDPKFPYVITTYRLDRALPVRRHEPLAAVAHRAAARAVC